MIKYLCTLLLIGICSTLLAQEVISSAGATSVTEGLAVSYTVGETFVHTSSHVLEGFHQPEEITVTGITTVRNSQVLIYPNPTTSEVNIKLNSNKKARVVIQDIKGQIINDLFMSKLSILDMSRYKSGTYLLTIYCEEIKETYQIIKK